MQSLVCSLLLLLPLTGTAFAAHKAHEHSPRDTTFCYTQMWPTQGALQYTQWSTTTICTKQKTTTVTSMCASTLQQRHKEVTILISNFNPTHRLYHDLYHNDNVNCPIDNRHGHYHFCPNKHQNRYFDFSGMQEMVQYSNAGLI